MDVEGSFNLIKNIFMYTIVVLLVIVIIINFNTKWQLSSIATSESKVATGKMATNAPTYIDYVVLFLLVGTLLLLIINPMNVLTDRSPVVVILYIILSLAIPFFAMIISNVFFGLTGNAILSTASSRLPITSFLLNHYGIVALIYVSISVIFYFMNKDA